MDRIPRQGSHRLDAAQRLHAEGMVGQHQLGEVAVDEIVGRVEVDVDLGEHDLALGLHVGLGVAGVDQHVRQHVEGDRQVTVEHPGVEAGHLLGGEGVHLPADGVELLGDLPCAAARRALEQQVLEEVRAPELPSSRERDPQPQRHRADVVSVTHPEPDGSDPHQAQRRPPSGRRSRRWSRASRSPPRGGSSRSRRTHPQASRQRQLQTSRGQRMRARRPAGRRAPRQRSAAGRGPRPRQHPQHEHRADEQQHPARPDQPSPASPSR
jgi:hypothetical protein